MLHGSCLCGGIRYRVAAEVNEISHCHCKMCQKSHGAAFATYAGVARQDLQIEQGADLLQAYSSSPSVQRSFCRRCGSSLFWECSARFGGRIYFAVGSLDEDCSPSLQRHIHCRSRAPWYAICDAWPQADEY